MLRPTCNINSIYKKRRYVMAEEKREETKEQIAVLDEGIKMDDIVDSFGICCSGPLTPFR